MQNNSGTPLSKKATTQKHDNLSKSSTNQFESNQAMEYNDDSDSRRQQREDAKKRRQESNKNMYKATRATDLRKPDTIVYALDVQQVARLKNVNLDMIVTNQTRAKVRAKE